MTSRIQTMHEATDLLAVLIWQYNHESNDSIELLLKKKGLWYQTQVDGFWESWLRDVFDIRTANKFGLQVWANFLGVSFTVPDCPNKELSELQKKTILRLRFDQLSLRPTIPNINQQLKRYFGDGVYALDPLDMSSITYVFTEQPSDELLLILAKYDLLLRPSTVGKQYRVLRRVPFGFGQYYQNFENGTFYGGDELLDYGWAISLRYDPEQERVAGSLSSNDASVSLGGVDITIIYTNVETEKRHSNTVQTADDGSFFDDNELDPSEWSAVAKAQILSPVCTTDDVSSPVISFSNVGYVFDITADFDSKSRSFKGAITCTPPVPTLAGQTVVIRYTPDAGNTDAPDVIEHRIVTLSDGSYNDSNTPNKGKYTAIAECNITISF